MPEEELTPEQRRELIKESIRKNLAAARKMQDGQPLRQRRRIIRGCFGGPVDSKGSDEQK